MELKDGKLIVTAKEYNLVKRWNAMASPYVAGMYLYNELKRNGIVMEWNAIFFKDVYVAFRKKQVEVVEEDK